MPGEANNKGEGRDLLSRLSPEVRVRAQELEELLFPLGPDAPEDERVTMQALSVVMGQVLAHRTKAGGGEPTLLAFGLGALHGMITAATAYYATRLGLELPASAKGGELQ